MDWGRIVATLIGLVGDFVIWPKSVAQEDIQSAGVDEWRNPAYLICLGRGSSKSAHRQSHRPDRCRNLHEQKVESVR